MGIRFECPRCRKHFSVKSEYAGKDARCTCGTLIIVPSDSNKIRFHCKNCGKGISVSNTHAGKKGKCPSCRNIIAVPLLGTLLAPQSQPPPIEPVVAAVPAGMISFSCQMCGRIVQAKQDSAGNIIECPACGAYVEIPEGYSAGADETGEAGKKPVVSTGKVVCPSCMAKLADDATVCIGCGIYVDSGRPILTVRGMDTDELEEKAHGVVKAISWLFPFGIYPVYSEAMGRHKPYATWGIAAVTVLVSVWFLAIQWSGSTQMRSAKNLMLWGGKDRPEPEHIRLIYEFTNYGDARAFNAKKEALSATTPENELDLAALKELTPEQRCFGEYRHVQLITHAFLHGGILHLAGNMLFLLVFGSRVNSAIGNILTVILYPILAVAAALTHLASMGAEPPTPMLGASGAVMGLAGAYLLLYPVHKVYMVIWMRWGLIMGFHLSYKYFALRGFWVVLFYIAFDVIAVSLLLASSTAHWAHIGGFVFGVVLAFILLAGRIAYSRSDVLSLVLGRQAWPIIGNPHSRMK
ncbi:MAG: rhomboid family intramembrane serine protease [Phycisphaerae bacterium]|nr:rhomboid family intramembrane serine protease [Phycisphaerae bacterium]NIS50238.1 rhomboid family intramembrane serine protease [Phycisphaerae bacterium]NIU07902.1 rhomboid family intramembrane serine protease [Phycisphaerae bacterium]NIU55504.1 rhomboid family intramembrane serine protease [Phycisphaerae bacterium]NIU99873.1 rhomboid family intramembrane serine protease [Phycisphaerae bacterium]